MSFQYPFVLLALLVPAALLVNVWSRRSGRTVLPFDHGTPGHGRVLAALVNAAESLPAALLTIAILLLAGPERQSEPKVKRSMTNIEFCVDVSGSMNASFGSGNRYDASMQAINDFLDYREGDAFGLTFFGNAVLHWVPLTNDVSAFRCAPPFMKPRSLPPWFNGTSIGAALLACRKVLTAREEGDRMIILVSDGVSSDLHSGADEEIARKLLADGIVVYTIHIGGGNIPGQVVNISSITGGEAFASTDPRALEVVFKRIDAMAETKLEKTAPEMIDDFEPLCIVGLVLLSVFGLVQFGLRYTPW